MAEDKLSNFIPISRKIFDHEFWTEKREFSPFEAWFDIIQTARYEENPMIELINGQNVSFGRGQLIGSVRFLQKRWNWGSTTKVSKFILELENRNMISCDKSQGVTVITLNNFDTYNKAKTIEKAKSKTKRQTIQKPKDTAKLSVASLSEEDSKEVYNKVKEHFLNMYKQEFNTDYYFQPKDASKVYELSKKVYFKMVERNNTQYSWEDISYGTTTFLSASLLSADTWLKANYTLSNIDSKFNEIFTTIKNPQYAVAANKKGRSRSVFAK